MRQVVAYVFRMAIHVPCMSRIGRSGRDALKKHTHDHTYDLAFGALVCIFMRMKSRDIIKAIKADGWFLVAAQGSHHQFKHPTKPGRVTVPHPKHDTPIGTVRSIEKQAGIKLK